MSFFDIPLFIGLFAENAIIPNYASGVIGSNEWETKMTLLVSSKLQSAPLFGKTLGAARPLGSGGFIAKVPLDLFDRYGARLCLLDEIRSRRPASCAERTNVYRHLVSLKWPQAEMFAGHSRPTIMNVGHTSSRKYRTIVKNWASPVESRDVKAKRSDIVIHSVAPRVPTVGTSGHWFELSRKGFSQAVCDFSEIVSAEFANSSLPGNVFFQFPDRAIALSTSNQFRRFLAETPRSIVEQALWLAVPSSDFTRQAILGLLLNLWTIQKKDGDTKTAFSSSEASELLFVFYESMIVGGRPKEQVLEHCGHIARNLGITSRHLR